MLDAPIHSLVQQHRGMDNGLLTEMDMLPKGEGP